MIRRLAERGALAALALTLSGLAGWAAEENDYPTDARVDYVFGCMAANGQTRQALERCSCSIDKIATLLPHSDYEEAQTVMSMNQVAGQMSEVFRSSAQLHDKVAELRRAQAEADIECFP